MTLADALDVVVRRTGHTHYRVLCDDANPDVAKRDAYRSLVLRKASSDPPAGPRAIRRRAPVVVDDLARLDAAFASAAADPKPRRSCCGGAAYVY